jgi:hypothetical protein
MHVDLIDEEAAAQELHDTVEYDRYRAASAP